MKGILFYKRKEIHDLMKDLSEVLNRLKSQVVSIIRVDGEWYGFIQYEKT